MLQFITHRFTYSLFCEVYEDFQSTKMYDIENLRALLIRRLQNNIKRN